MVDLPITYVVL